MNFVLIQKKKKRKKEKEEEEAAAHFWSSEVGGVPLPGHISLVTAVKKKPHTESFTPEKSPTFTLRWRLSTCLYMLT